MIFEDYQDMILETEDDRSMKIFEISHFEDEEMHMDDILLESDDSNMKIFFML